MNSFDVRVELFLNQFAGRWPRFDAALAVFTGLNLFKGGVIVALLWWMWGRREDRRRTRELVISTLFGVVLALGTTRLLSHLLPFRYRPLHDPSLMFRSPAGLDVRILKGWRAFPSDHAAMCFALATGLLLLHRRLGLIAWAYTGLFIALPRAYLGFHYPTDLIVGALLGVAAVLAASAAPIRERIARPVLALAARRPGAFHALLFLVTLQVANMFEAIRIVFGYARQ